MKALKIFKDLVAFLTIIPLAKDESFLETSARYMFLFPIVGAIIGLMVAAYFLLSYHIFTFILSSLSRVFPFPPEFSVRIFASAFTLAFLLVLTGLQHFDGLVDLGNVLGLKSLEERNNLAHAWVVTFKGAFFAFLVEFLNFLGIFLLDPSILFASLICGEVCAKLAMVTIAWVGKPAPGGKGSIFAEMNSRRKINFLACLLSLLIVAPLLRLYGVALILLSLALGIIMERVSTRLFGRVSGDVMGATNEIGRALSLLLIAAMVMA
ncbi:adenosylcobinamide-GDP ribazoletransferase [Candidatus Bathyarchaeota archaeon]|nr:adenosylcobinamide-GDP ribazoletransferase [Candidatus Bathyarchaeota archaeon]